MNNFDKFGLKIPEILIPKNGTDLKAWSVIACDQYTQDRDYWANAEKTAQGKPSTLNIILPEVYLSDQNKPERIKNIRKTMQEYLSDGVFAPAESEMIYIERKTAYGRIRKGLVTAIDLETYEWKPFSKALIRATEATIVERIPPRMEIRRGAPIESPHIMLLVNDSAKCLVEACGEEAKKSAALYDTDLMANSGHISGWAVKNEALLNKVQNALETLYKKNTTTDGSVFMFAVGDGNHSLATAKAVWDEFKEKNGGIKDSSGTVSIPKGLENHNARYALIEIVNIYDDGLTFEPIHRVLFNTNAKKLLDFLENKLNGKITDCNNASEMEQKIGQAKADFGFVWKENNSICYKILTTKITDLAVSRLQPALDEYLKAQNSSKEDIDYIHGTDEVFRLGAKENSIAILLPPIAKDSFFATIAGNGPLPRKSFSMGEASEKRFYMECRKLF